MNIESVGNNANLFQHTQAPKKLGNASVEIRLKKDEVSVSDAAKKLQAKGNQGTTEGLRILDSDMEKGSYSVRFDNTAYVYQALKRGSIIVNGNEILLDDTTKEKLEKSADKVFKAQESAIMMAAAEHNAMVAEQQGEAIRKQMKEEQKLMEIAMRIMKGGKVPPQDEKKLAEGNPEMYQMAMSAAATLKEKDGKEYDSVDKEEEDEKGDSNGSDSNNSDSPLQHIDRHYVDIKVSTGAEGGSIDSISESVVEM